MDVTRWVRWRLQMAVGPAGNRGAAANGSCLAQVGGRMLAFDQADPLPGALDELWVLAGVQERETIGDLRSRLAGQRLRVFVLTADPPVSASERELIAQVARLSAAMFVVLNKADYLSGGELAEVLEFTAEVVARAAGQPVRIYPVSARAALAHSGDAGFAGFEADFTAYLERGRVADLRRSAEGRARRIASSLRDEVALVRRAGEMRSTEAAQRVRAFAVRLAAVQGRRQDAADLTAAESRRMLDDLNEAAERAGPECTRRVSQQLANVLDG